MSGRNDLSRPCSRSGCRRWECTWEAALNIRTTSRKGWRTSHTLSPMQSGESRSVCCFTGFEHTPRFIIWSCVLSVSFSSVPNRYTFTCPYCNCPNFDQDGLVEHCNSQHAHDPRPVVSSVPSLYCIWVKKNPIECEWELRGRILEQKKSSLCYLSSLM